MYQLSDSQIDFILNDIRARGVEIEGLQDNLLDHVCCIIEQHLEANGDFESFYQKTIQTFFKDALWEIEEETLLLLTFKNYYTMKKIMNGAGIFSAITLLTGLYFKFSHFPGAAILLILGISSASLIFLPLMFVLKSKEKKSLKDKLIIGLGGIAAILLSMSILFKVMYWPFAGLMSYLALGIIGFVFLPAYFFTGIRNPETKVNTVTSSILILLGLSLILILVRTPKSSLQIDVKNTRDFVRSQQILDTEKRQLHQQQKADSLHNVSDKLGNTIISNCDDLKAFILKSETGVETLDENFETNNILLRDHSIKGNPFEENSEINQVFESLRKQVVEYNSKIKTSSLSFLPAKDTFLEYFEEGVSGNSLHTLSVLNQLTQIQFIVLQNDRDLLASN
jgi:hypothetical protein